VDLDVLRNRLREAFPPQRVTGLVSIHDECDDGIALRRELPGKSWDEISAQFVDENSLSLPLLEPDALVAFLPAWLLRSLETFNEGSLVWEFTLYFLSPGDPQHQSPEKVISEVAEPFGPAQREVVGDFFRAILESTELHRYHKHARDGLRQWCA
jgi:hypothetical protein